MTSTKRKVQEEKPLVFFIRYPFIIVNTLKCKNLANIFLFLNPIIYLFLMEAFSTILRFPWISAWGNLIYLAAVNFSLAYASSSRWRLMGKCWRLNLIDTGLVASFFSFSMQAFFCCLYFINTVFLNLSPVKFTILHCLPSSG